MTILIEDITWERALLHIQYRTTDASSLVLCNIRTGQFIFFSEAREGDVVRATLNITQAAGREPLPDGEWVMCEQLPAQARGLAWAEGHAPYLVALAEKRLADEQARRRLVAKLVHRKASTAGKHAAALEAELQKCPIDAHGITYAPELIQKLDELDRVFRYVDGKYACAVSLIPVVYITDYFVVKLTADYYVKNKRPQTRRLSVRQFQKTLFSLYYRVVRMFLRPKGNRVLFLKENGEALTDNMAAIRNRIQERGLEGEFPITERYRNTFTERQNLGSWLRDINAIAHSSHIFIDDYCPVFNFLNLDDRTVLTQVWHAGVGFKSVGYARFGISGSPDPYQAGHRRYTYALVGNQHLRPIYSEVFGIEEEALLATGMPRLDHFLDEDRMNEAVVRLEDKYPWMREGRVIVFAPTFRGPGQATAYYPYEEFFDYQALYEMCERTNSYFVFEMHHFISERPRIPAQYASRLFDLSDENLNDLLYVADVLVTDYSSCFYDCLLLNKPVVFYVPDKITYSVTRGVQGSVDETAPGVVCDTFDQFIGVLEHSEYEAYPPAAAMIDRRFENTGLATDRVIDTVLLGEDVPGVRICHNETN